MPTNKATFFELSLLGKVLLLVLIRLHIYGQIAEQLWASVSHSAMRCYTGEKFLYPKVSGLTHPQGQADGWTLALQGAKDRAILVGQGFVGPVSEALG